MHLEHHHTCSAAVPHHLRGGDWISVCPNPIGAKCYKCDQFYCDDHIRKHDCNGNDDHPASD